MKHYNKMLVAINNKELKCHSEKGDWLYIAGTNDTKKGLFRIAKEHHYFVSLTAERMPSELGVVKKIKEGITAYDLAKLDFYSRGIEAELIDEIVIKEYESFLITINSQPEHTPMAVTWLEKLVGFEKKKELRVHKVFFLERTKEEKDRLFKD
ncbi:hypothetical protein [Shouchella miscanthi]|uniref:hypothetical protein n=1 Tax=Shouchella miscanthi TaxID=2598861 RepID=UPI0011A2B0FE|nr:hypothetical protein [Shouchella miscanthi]